MKKITLLVDGKEFILNEDELSFINAMVEKKIEEGKAKFKPKEGEWFEVKPQMLNKELFKDKKRDFKQEKTRLLILEAFIELEKNPQKYGRTFEIVIPNWKCPVRRTANGFISLANQVGNQIADWVELALNWAQRICNGETWESICNEPDTCMYYRVVEWKDGRVQFVGGSCSKILKAEPASSVHEEFDQSNSFWFERSVPLLVRYK